MRMLCTWYTKICAHIIYYYAVEKCNTSHDFAVLEDVVASELQTPVGGFNSHNTLDANFA